MDTNVTVVGMVCLCIVAIVGIVFGRQVRASVMDATVTVGQLPEQRADRRNRTRGRARSKEAWNDRHADSV